MFVTLDGTVNTSCLGRQLYDDWPSGCGITLYHEPVEKSYCRGITVIHGLSQEVKSDDFGKMVINTANGPLTVFWCKTPGVTDGEGVGWQDPDNDPPDGVDAADILALSDDAGGNYKEYPTDSALKSKICCISSEDLFEPILFNPNVTYLYCSGPHHSVNKILCNTINLRVVENTGEIAYNNHGVHKGEDGVRLGLVVLDYIGG